MQKQIDDLRKKFDGKLVARVWLQKIICETLLHFPKPKINYVAKHVWFMSSFDDAWGFAFNGSDLKNQHLIFLSDELLRESKAQIMHTVAHEVAHIILNHRNSTLYKQSKEEVKKQEKEADHFARYYLNTVQP